jgi:MFS family permease
MPHPPSAEASSPAHTRTARLSVALLLAINMFTYIDRYILAAVEPEIRRQFFPGVESAAGASARDEMMAAMAKTGSLATAFLVSYMIAAPILSSLAARVNRWLMVGLAVAVWSLATGASGLAGTFAALILARCFVGIGEAGYGPVAPAMIADLYPVEKRGSKLAWFYMAIPVGSALGYLIGGQASGQWGWRSPFFLMVAPGLLLTALCLFMARRQPRPTPAPSRHPEGVSTTEGSSRERRNAPLGARSFAALRMTLLQATQVAAKHLRTYLRILKTPSYLLNTAAMTAMTFAIGGFSFWMPAYLADDRHAGSLARVNTLFGGITVVAGITSTLAGGYLGDRLRKRLPGAYFLVSAAGMLLAACFILLMTHAPFPLAWLWVFLAVFFLFFNTGPSNTALANVVPPALRANAFALNILLIHALGDAISPPILGAVIGKYSWNASLYLVCATMAVAALLWFAGAPYLKRDTDRAEAAA